MIDIEERRQGTAVERHFVTGLTVLLVGLLGWGGTSILGQGRDQIRNQAIMDGKLTAVEKEVGYLRETIKTAGSDRYTGKEARADKARVALIREADLRASIRIHEQCNVRMSRIEASIEKHHRIE